MAKIGKERIKEILSNAQGKSIAVIGDVMLDRYFWGSVSRVSPEAPVPVVDVEDETFHLGGAANVAMNMKSLGIAPLLCGIIGDDNSSNIFVDIAKIAGMDCRAMYKDSNRPTTVKTRVMGNNQHIVRLDREVRNPLPSDAVSFILDNLDSTSNLSAIIFEDYNKGTITEELIIKISDFAKSRNLPIMVDPKFDNFFAFQGCTLFKPNRKEASAALKLKITTKDDVIIAGKELLTKLNCKNVLLTLGSDGMMLFEDNGDTSSMPTIARSVADVSGAGDTAIATLSVALVGQATTKEATYLANLASGLVCQKPGIVSVTIEELIEALEI